MAMKGRPWSSSASWIVQMCGWLSGEAARASRLKRSTAWRVPGQLVRQELERHLAAEARVFGLVDDAHAAAADLLEDPVVREGLADHVLWGRRTGMLCPAPGRASNADAALASAPASSSRYTCHRSRAVCAQHRLQGEEPGAADRLLEVAQLVRGWRARRRRPAPRARPRGRAGGPSRGSRARPGCARRQSMSATTSPGKRAFSERRYSPSRVSSAWPETIDSSSSRSVSRPTPSQSRVARSLRSKTATTRSGQADEEDGPRRAAAARRKWL